MRTGNRLDRLVKRWDQLGERIGVTDKQFWNEAFLDLINKYSEPHRGYHVIAHIEYCLNYIKLASKHAKDIDAVETAVWFHDIIYEPGKKDNELRSADFAKETLLRAGIEESFANKVRMMILLTTHKAAPAQIDARLVLDIDLSPLAARRRTFNRNTGGLRREFASAGVTDAQFDTGQSAFLATFIERPSIYLTDAFRSKLERRARRNVSRVIEAMRS